MATAAKKRQRVKRSIDAAEAALKDLRVGTEKGRTAISKAVCHAMRADEARRRRITR